MTGKKQKPTTTPMIALQNQVDALSNQVTILSGSIAGIQKTLDNFNAGLNNLTKSAVSHTHKFALESLPGVNNEQVWTAFMQAQGFNPDGTPLPPKAIVTSSPEPEEEPKAPRKKPPKKKKTKKAVE